MAASAALEAFGQSVTSNSEVNMSLWGLNNWKANCHQPKHRDRLLLGPRPSQIYNINEKK